MRRLAPQVEIVVLVLAATLTLALGVPAIRSESAWGREAGGLAVLCASSLLACLAYYVIERPRGAILPSTAPRGAVWFEPAAVVPAADGQVAPATDHECELEPADG